MPTEASGIRHAEIVNWTGQAIAAPRPRYVELKSWPEVCRPGIYFLVGFSDDTSEGKVYIGESENVFDRLADHIRNKEFWRECIVFSSKDQNLTKGHVKYLESRLIALADKANRYFLDNSDRPAIPALPRADSDTMEEFIDFVRITLGALGYPVIEPLQTKLVDAGFGAQARNTTLGRDFAFSGNAFSARGTQSDEGFIVFADSLVAKEAAQTTPAHVKTLRESAISEQRMIIERDKYKLVSDMLFTSSSAAAAFVAGSNRNGREAWADKDGRTLKEIEETLASNAGGARGTGALPGTS
ncbi:MAG: GIY-YIG nuclease family protein [Planctomycetota bacterium]